MFPKPPRIFLVPLVAVLTLVGCAADDPLTVNEPDTQPLPAPVEVVQEVEITPPAPGVVENYSYAPTPFDLSALEPISEVMLDEYDWGSGENVESLQTFLGVTVDGDYGPQTRTAHVKLLEGMGWSTSNVPDAPSSGSSISYNPNPTPQCTEWWDTARAAGWSEDRLPKLGRIMFAESRCTHDVVSRTKDYGLTQINWAAHGSRLTDAGITRDMLLDAYTNLVQAKWIADYAEKHYGCWSQPWYMSGDWC